MIAIAGHSPMRRRSNEMRALVVAVAAIFLDAMFESELAELDDEAAEMLEMSEQDEAGLDQLARPVQENVRGGASHRLTMARSSGWLSPPPPRPTETWGTWPCYHSTAATVT